MRKTRKFNGKRYKRIFGIHSTKDKARARANYRRKNKKQYARVVKHGGGYAVYVRSRGRR